MNRVRPMGESFDHRPAGWIRQGRQLCIELIHNHLVVNYPSMSSVDFGVPDFCFLLPLEHPTGGVASRVTLRGWPQPYAARPGLVRPRRGTCQGSAPKLLAEPQL